MQRTEIAHHTPEQIEGYARLAREVAERVYDDPEDVRAVLPQLIALFAAKNIQIEQFGPGPVLPGLHRNAIGR